jgi:excisionase family DNA binding protein
MRQKQVRPERKSSLTPGSESRSRLITNREFCSQLGMSEMWGRKMIASRGVNVVRIGRSVRIPAGEVERFISANLVPASRHG